MKKGSVFCEKSVKDKAFEVFETKEFTFRK
jgi:hypothetical protein